MFAKGKYAICGFVAAGTRATGMAAKLPTINERALASLPDRTIARWTATPGPVKRSCQRTVPGDASRNASAWSRTPSAGCLPNADRPRRAVPPHSETRA